MPDKLFIKAASSLIIADAMESLREVAKKHYQTYSSEYIENMLLLSVLGHSIATGKDKQYLVEVFTDLINMQNKDDEDELINQAKELL